MTDHETISSTQTDVAPDHAATSSAGQRRRRRLLFGLSAAVTGMVAIGAVAAGLLASGTIVSAQATQTPEPATTSVKPPTVTVMPAVREMITETTMVTGTLVARELVRVNARVDALAIAEILIEEGDTVAEGQVLARLSREMIDVAIAQSDAQIARAAAAIDQAQSMIDEARATLDQAQSAYDRAKALAQSGAATVDTVEQREAAAKTAQARLSSAEQSKRLAQADKALAEAQRAEQLVRLDRTEVKAPTAGIVTRRNARLGTVVSGAGEPLFEIMRDGAIELDAKIPETTLGRLKEGLSAKVYTAARPEPVDGTLRLISPEVDPTTRLGNVRIAVTSAPGLRVGAFGRAEIEIATREGVLAPQSAILYTPDGAEVQVVKEGVVATRRVTIGLRTPKQAEIVEGLDAGEDIVLTAGTFVRDGDRVTPVTAPAAVSSAN